MLLTKKFDFAPSCKDIQNVLLPLIKKYMPESILTDNNPFKEEWDKWCKLHGANPLHTHPYYPQDNGKVERAIRNVSEEFIYLIKKFPHWLEGFIEKYRYWYNNHRLHLGIDNYPVKLFS